MQNIDFLRNLEEKDIPDRFDLFSDIDEALLKKTKHAYTLIQISIDNYGDINEYFGIEISKEIIKNFYAWLQANQPVRNCKIYRFEMDKFAIFITSRTKVKDIDDYVNFVIEQITQKSFLINQSLYSISISIGVARGRKDIFKRSYLALSHAKKADKSYIIYNHKDKIEENFLKNIKIHQEIKEAIENDKIVAFLQPIYNLKSNKIEKYEALMRIKNSDGSYKLPMEFLDIAKKARLYTKLTQKIIDLSIENLKKISSSITINLSIEDIEDKFISQYIYQRVKESNLAHLITFEILETKEITSFLKAAKFIKRLKSLGCKFAVDDFGSGYSNFNNILRLDIDFLKIDGSIIKNINKNKKNEIFVKTIVNFSKELNIKTVAEYVCNEKIYSKVKSLGVDYVQGHYISKPKIC